jgi:hypothetical protein
MSNSKLNIQFNEKQGQALEEMAEELGTTKANVLKTALSLLQLAIREKKSGNGLGVIKEDKVVKEIVGLD